MSRPRDLSNVLSGLNANIVFASGKGIDFSANANAAGMTSELLDDYEEGTWTPTLDALSTSPTAVTYSKRVGEYVKIGKLVYVVCDVVWSGLSGAAGAAVINNLPFSVSTTNGFPIPTIRDADGLTASGSSPLTGSFGQNNFVRFQTEFPAPSFGTDAISCTLDSSGRINMSLVYVTA